FDRRRAEIRSAEHHGADARQVAEGRWIAPARPSPVQAERLGDMKPGHHLINRKVRWAIQIDRVTESLADMGIAPSHSVIPKIIKRRLSAGGAHRLDEGLGPRPLVQGG